jgi:hypothetical protein
MGTFDQNCFSNVLLIAQEPMKARNDEWVGARPDVGSSVLLWM